MFRAKSHRKPVLLPLAEIQIDDVDIYTTPSAESSLGPCKFTCPCLVKRQMERFNPKAIKMNNSKQSQLLIQENESQGSEMLYSRQ